MLRDPKSQAKMIALAEFAYEQSQGPHDVFFEYSPFLNCVRIEAYAGGWEKTTTPDYSQWLSLDPHYHVDKVEDITQSIIDFLEIC